MLANVRRMQIRPMHFITEYRKKMSNIDLCISDNRNDCARILSIYQDVNYKCVHVCVTEDNPVIFHNLFLIRVRNDIQSPWDHVCHSVTVVTGFHLRSHCFSHIKGEVSPDRMCHRGHIRCSANTTTVFLHYLVLHNMVTDLHVS